MSWTSPLACSFQCYTAKKKKLVELTLRSVVFLKSTLDNRSVCGRHGSNVRQQRKELKVHLCRKAPNLIAPPKEVLHGEKRRIRIGPMARPAQLPAATRAQLGPV